MLFVCVARFIFAGGADGASYVLGLYVDDGWLVTSVEVVFPYVTFAGAVFR